MDVKAAGKQNGHMLGIVGKMVARLELWVTTQSVCDVSENKGCLSCKLSFKIFTTALVTDWEI